jgi:nucleotide-binding universal stress UspA family protein
MAAQDLAARTDVATPPGGARHVVVATDGSDASVAAAHTAAHLFADADISLVTVIDAMEDPMVDAGGFEGPAMDQATAREDYREHTVDAQGALAATARAFGPRAVHQRIIEQDGEGRGARLCAFVEDEDVDVLVIGSHGHGVVADAILGSVRSHVVHHCTCPVLLVPPPPDPD